jgi:hypothetical protein
LGGQQSPAHSVAVKALSFHLCSLLACDMGWGAICHAGCTAALRETRSDLSLLSHSALTLRDIKLRETEGPMREEREQRWPQQCLPLLPSSLPGPLPCANSHRQR